MIYFVEIPHQRNASCWSALDSDDAVSRLALSSAYLNSGETVFEKTTVRELLGNHGYESLEEAVESGDEEWLVDLAQRFGLDTQIYRGYGSDGYTAEVIDEFESWVDWLGSDLNSLKVFESDSEALAALANDSEWKVHQGGRAWQALKNALVREGVLPEED